MDPLIRENRDQIAELCRRHGVRRLDVFGSAARGRDFAADRSDVDFLVELEPSGDDGPTVSDYFSLRAELTRMLGRPVDLVMAGGVRNPYVKAEIERSRQPVYAA